MSHTGYRSLDLLTAPVKEPITTAVTKAHLQVEFDDDNALIDALITAARQHVEEFTRRALVTQTWKLHLDEFPWSSGEPIFVPKPPLQSVTSITYIDPAGDTQTWSSSLYQVTTPAGDQASHGRILPASSEIYPSTQQQMEAVTITYVAGYGLGDGGAVPEGILAAMKLLIGSWYTNRESISKGSMEKIPDGVDAILWPYRALRFG